MSPMLRAVTSLFGRSAFVTRRMPHALSMILIAVTAAAEQPPEAAFLRVEDWGRCEIYTIAALSLPETGVEAAQVAETLRKKIASLIVTFAAQIIHVSASFGVAVFSKDDTDFNQIVARADNALYEAKSGGRNRVVVHGVLAH